MNPAASDERTARHERAKDRAFVGMLLLAGSLLVIGIILLPTGGAWSFLGGFLFLCGGSFGAASLIGLTYRRKARKVLQTHEWIVSPATVRGRPKSGRNGRTLVELTDSETMLAISGLDPAVANRIDREGRVEHAGDLTGTALLFVRVVDGEEIYVAVVPRKVTS